MATKKIGASELLKSVGLAAMGEPEALQGLLGTIQKESKKELKESVDRERALREADGEEETIETEGEEVTSG